MHRSRQPQSKSCIRCDVSTTPGYAGGGPFFHPNGNEAGAPEGLGLDKFVCHPNGVKFIADGRKLVKDLIEIRTSHKLRTYDLGPIEFYGLDNGGS
jgi:hypothetical protein